MLAKTQKPYSCGVQKYAQKCARCQILSKGQQVLPSMSTYVNNLQNVIRSPAASADSVPEETPRLVNRLEKNGIDPNISLKNFFEFVSIVV